MKNILTLPRLALAAIGTFINSIIIKNYYQAPLSIGKYKLLREVYRRDRVKNLTMGIYQFQHKKFFIKSWSGKVKDLSYYYLLNEFYLQSYLNQKISTQYFAFPTSVDLISHPQTLSAVFEYIDGHSLEKAPIHQQVEVIESIIKELAKFSSPANPLSRRGQFQYILMLPFIYLASLIIRPLSLRQSNLALLKCLRSFFSDNFAVKLSLAHRDLTPDNVIISGKKIYLLDSENIILTWPNYDLVFLSIFPKYRRLYQSLSSKMSVSESIFLKNYLLLQQSLIIKLL